MSRGRNALLLGSGFVATPTVDVLSKAGISVTVACRTLEAAQKLAGEFKGASAISLDVTDSAALEKAVAGHDVTISLIPYTFHATVIKAAIKAKKHVVTTSYVSPAMMELDAEAKEAGITVMNEIVLTLVLITFTLSRLSMRCTRPEEESQAFCHTAEVSHPPSVATIHWDTNSHGAAEVCFLH